MILITITCSFIQFQPYLLGGQSSNFITLQLKILGVRYEILLARLVIKLLFPEILTGVTLEMINSLKNLIITNFD